MEWRWAGKKKNKKTNRIIQKKYRADMIYLSEHNVLRGFSVSIGSLQTSSVDLTNTNVSHLTAVLH